MFLREFCWDTADATLVTKTCPGEGRDHGSERPHCYRSKPKDVLLIPSAKDTDETDKSEADEADIAVAQSSEVLRNTMMFVVSLRAHQGIPRLFFPTRCVGS